MRHKKEIESKIKRYLGSIFSGMAATPRDELRDVINNVERHIYDELSKRCPGEPTLEDLDEVLSNMDTPESYAVELTRKQRIVRIWSILVLVLDVASALSVIFATLPIRGKFLETFEDFGVEALPKLTAFMLSIPFTTCIVVSSVFLIVALVTKEIYFRSSSRSLHLNIFAAACLAVYWFAYVHALFLPLTEIIAEMSP